MELSLKRIAKWVFQELPKKEQELVWRDMKREPVYIEDADTLERLKQQHNLKSSEELLIWLSEKYESAHTEFNEFSNIIVNDIRKNTQAQK